MGSLLGSKGHKPGSLSRTHYCVDHRFYCVARFPWTPRDSQTPLPGLPATPRLPWTPRDSQTPPDTPLDSQLLPGTPLDSQALPGTPRLLCLDSPGLPGTPRLPCLGPSEACLGPSEACPRTLPWTPRCYLDTPLDSHSPGLPWPPRDSQTSLPGLPCTPRGSQTPLSRAL